MLIKLSKGKPLFRFSGVDFDKQDLLIVTILVVIIVGLSLATYSVGLNGMYVIIPSLFVASIVFRNVLIAKGKVQKKLMSYNFKVL